MTEPRSLKDIFEGLSAALVTDPDLATFMTTTYGTSAAVNVQIGRDPEDYPDATKTACVYLVPGSRSRTRGDAYRRHYLTAVCWVHSPSKTKQGNISTLECIGLLDEFTNLVEACLYRYLTGSQLAVSFTGGESDEVDWPDARSELAYIIEIPSRI